MPDVTMPEVTCFSSGKRQKFKTSLGAYFHFFMAFDLIFNIHLFKEIFKEEGLF